MNSNPSKTILFITGAFISSCAWDEWHNHFQKLGFDTIAPPWPHKDAPAEVLRNRQPDSDIAAIRLDELADYYAGIALSLSENPILVGHSMGGLIVQLLLQRSIGAAGVAIHSVPPKGVMPTSFSFFRSTFKPLGFFTSTKKSHLMSFSEWQYAITNGMQEEDQKKAYYDMAVPESKLVLRDTLTNAAKIDFKKPHAPLLLISGSTDHIMPAKLNYANYKKYSNNGSITDYKMFEGRNHYVLGLPTWREEAGFIYQWLINLPKESVQTGSITALA